MRQIVQIFQCFGSQRSTEEINEYLDKNPTYRIDSVTPVKIDYVGDKVGCGVLVVFEYQP